MVQYLKCKSLSVLPMFLALTNSEFKFYEKNLLWRLLILNVLLLYFVFWEDERKNEGRRKEYPNIFNNFIIVWLHDLPAG